MNQNQIRNFAIIAHIDHGKSTLADRLLELTGTVEKRMMQEQMLDSNPIERERGITIKLAPVRMEYTSNPTNQTNKPIRPIQIKNKVTQQWNNVAMKQSSDGEIQTGFEYKDDGEDQHYVLNLIDTPGHVDFSYEVSRSLAACEGAILVVDATQGVQAQTLAHLAHAREHKLTIIPVINKIDLPNARIEETLRELGSLEFSEDEVIKISAKTGENVGEVLEAIVARIPPPRGDPAKPLRALVFSSQYDPHKGVIVFVRIVDGLLLYDLDKKQHNRVRFLASNAEVTPIETGYFIPRMRSTQTLSTGEVGYIATGLKDIKLAKVGDTITISNIKNSREAGSRSARQISKRKSNQAIQQFNNVTIFPLPGYKEPKPMVFLGLFPIASDEYQFAREAMEKLRLSDSAFTFRPISSTALGLGFHCGFLGLLHGEIVQERLLREFNLSVIATAPNVEYRVKLKTQSSNVKSQASDRKDEYIITIQSASEFPDPSTIEEVEEPVMRVTVYTPSRYIGAVMQLATEKRGQYIDTTYQAQQATLTYLLPLSEMIIDFFDRVKSITEGYGSIDYEFFDYQKAEVVRLDVLVNKERVDAFSQLVVAVRAHEQGRNLVDRLANAIPRQQFLVPIQAAIGGSPRSSSGGAGTIIARADVKAFRKDVTQKLYGGDRTRKDKLLEAQKKGKAKLKLIGRVAIPQSVFFEVLKHD